MIAFVRTRTAFQVNFEELKNRNDIDHVVLMNEEEYNYMNFAGTFNFYTLLDWVNEKNIKLTVVNGWRKDTPPMHDINDEKFNCIDSIISWETYFLNLTFLSHTVRMNNSELNSERDINFTFTCLNNKPHPHRCKLMDLFGKYSLIDNQAISWVQPTFNTSLTYNFSYWQETKLLLEDNYEKTLNHFQNLPESYHSSLFQVINESTMDCYFLTEKTAIPLFLEKPFIVINKKNYNFWLKDLGFELYDEMFDYSFDSIDNDDERFEAGVQEIARLNSLSRSEQFNLYIKIKDKLTSNKMHAIELTKVCPDIVKPVFSNAQLNLNNDYHIIGD